jgi:Na+-transporting NADH:ubiquinone oxidoreductase subunit NqrF
MSSLMDGAFIKRRCYLKLGAGTAMSCIRLRADCFFRHWPLKAVGIDEEGYVRAVAMASYPDRRQVTEVELRIDPVTSDLIEYCYTEQGSSRVFALVDGEYLERASGGQGEQRTID